MSSSAGRRAVPPLAIGALLRFALQELRERIYEGVIASGFDDLRPAHVTLFRWPGPDRQRPSTLAEAAGISKQAVNDLLRDLERRGYLRLRADPADNRARIITLSARGRRLHRTALAVHAQIEADWAQALGSKQFADVRQGLATLVRRSGGPLMASSRPARTGASGRNRRPAPRHR